MTTTTESSRGRNDKPGEKRNNNGKKGNMHFEVVDFDELSPAEEVFGEEFDSRLIGQPEARQIALDVRARYRNPMRNRKHPLGIYYLIGKSRRGKSLLAQVLADLFHGDDEALIRITSEDYLDDSQMSDLTGSTPKYVGYRAPVDAKTMEVEKLRKLDGYSKVSDWNRIRVRLNSQETIDIVVLEEFSKSGPDFYKFWMEVFDKGKKTLGNGEMADFTNTVFILTDNLGMDKVEKEENGQSIGFNSGQKKVLNHEEVASIVESEMKRRFKPEFRNRIDQVTVYRELTPEETMQIVHIQVRQFSDRIIDQMPRGDDFELDVQQSACDFLLKTADNDVANLKRTIMKFVEVPLGRMLDRDNPNKVLGGDLVRVTWDGKSAKLSFGIARGEGNVNTDIEGLKRYLGDTPENQKGLAFQRRLAKVRGAVKRENQKDWSCTIKGGDMDELQAELYTVQHEMKEVFGVKICNMSVSFEAPYIGVCVVRGTKEQMDMVAQMFPDVTIKEMTRALVVVKDPKKS